MGGTLPKQYLPLSGRPLLAHTLSALISHPRIEHVFLVLSPDDSHWEMQATPSQKLTVLRCGGETRAQTVTNGLHSLADQLKPDDWVLVHDAARPCVRQEHLDKMFEMLADDPVGGILAMPVADTLKRADPEQRIVETVSRESLWQAQTPQMFRYGLLLNALQKAGDQVTDEASAIERMGLKPKLVDGDAGNLKVTYPRDLELAALILQQQR